MSESDFWRLKCRVKFENETSLFKLPIVTHTQQDTGGGWYKTPADVGWLNSSLAKRLISVTLRWVGHFIQRSWNWPHQHHTNSHHFHPVLIARQNWGQNCVLRYKEQDNSWAQYYTCCCAWSMLHRINKTKPAGYWCHTMNSDGNDIK